MDRSLVFTMCVLCVCVLPTRPDGERHKLLLFMLDGCRNLYLKDYIDHIPGFRHFFKIGSRAEYVDPQFPTMTFPNFYTLMTGLYPESHGIVGNFMWDELKNESFNMALSPPDIHPHWWEGGEPIWVTAEKQGLRAYMFNWYACEVYIHGVRATHCHPYADIPPLHIGMDDVAWQVDQAVSALINGSADLAGVYTEVLDQAAHRYTPAGEGLLSVLKWFDDLFYTIHRRFVDAGMADKVNIVIFSDHGSTETTRERNIELEKYITPEEDYDVIKEVGAKVSIWPKKNKLEELYQKLKTISPHLTVYKKEEIPDKWHHKGHRRVAPIIVVSDFGWMISTPEMSYPVSEYGWEYMAFHGFNPDDYRMKAILVGVGPNFRRGVVVPHFANTNMYELMCKLLRIKPAPNNGSWENVANMYQEAPEPTLWTLTNLLYLVVVLAVCGAIIGLNSSNRRTRFKYQ